MQSYTRDERRWLNGERDESNVRMHDLTFFYSPFHFCHAVEALNRTREPPVDYDYNQVQSNEARLCAYCNEASFTFRKLKEHMLVKHPEDVRKFWCCYKCPLETVFSGYLTYHLKVEHHIAVDTDYVDEYLCVTKIGRDVERHIPESDIERVPSTYTGWQVKCVFTTSCSQWTSRLHLHPYTGN